MKYHTQYKKYRWFVYRYHNGDPVDIRTPIGGVTSYGTDEVEALDHAYQKAERRFPVRPWEILTVEQVTDAPRRRQAWLMERAWKREMAEFLELMA